MWGASMFGTDTARPRRRSAMAIAVVASLSVTTMVAAQEGPVPTSVTLSPASSLGPTGSCAPYTATVTAKDQPVQGAIVDVLQIMNDARTEPEENRELYFCDPSHPRNPTGQGGTTVGDVGGNNPTQIAGAAGRNTSVHAEAGPTNANGEVTFGITMAPDIANANVTLTAWVDLDGDDVRDEGEPWDASQHQWVHADRPVPVIDAGPETALNPNGTTHTVTVVVTTREGHPYQGFIPDSYILPNAANQPAGDVADPNAGTSPNATRPGAPPNAYSCTPSNSQGLSTCTFQDPLSTPAGTDTIVFFWDLGGEARVPDGPDPRDAVQKTWMPMEEGGPPTPPPTPTPTPTPPPTASPSPSPSVSPSPTPTPAGPAGARNIRLCQGSFVAPCVTSPGFAEVYDVEEVSAFVTNHQGSPVANVPVLFTETGPARFMPTGADAVLASTDADGIARAAFTSEEEGTSTVVAEISPPGTTGSFRGPGAADDECEQPAGPGGVPAAGNCISRSVTVDWVETGDPIDCYDAIDNDGDTLIDYPDDPGCTDERDGTEEPFNPIPPEVVRHHRSISMHFGHRDGGADDRLVVSGRVRLEDEDDTFLTCRQGQTVLIQRREDGQWVTKDEASTNARGRYSGVLRDRPGRYRATVVRARVATDDDEVHECLRARKEKPHRHRG